MGWMSVKLNFIFVNDYELEIDGMSVLIPD